MPRSCRVFVFALVNRGFLRSCAAAVDSGVKGDGLAVALGLVRLVEYEASSPWVLACLNQSAADVVVGRVFVWVPNSSSP